LTLRPFFPAAIRVLYRLPPNGSRRCRRLFKDAGPIAVCRHPFFGQFYLFVLLVNVNAPFFRRFSFFLIPWSSPVHRFSIWSPYATQCQTLLFVLPNVALGFFSDLTKSFFLRRSGHWICLLSIDMAWCVVQLEHVFFCFFSQVEAGKGGFSIALLPRPLGSRSVFLSIRAFPGTYQSSPPPPVPLNLYIRTILIPSVVVFPPGRLGPRTVFPRMSFLSPPECPPARYLLFDARPPLLFSGNASTTMSLPSSVASHIAVFML